MMQRTSTEGPEEGDVGAHHDVDLPAAPTGEVNDNYPQKSVSQMDDNNEQERSRGAEGQRSRGAEGQRGRGAEEQRGRGAEGNDNYTCNEARRTTTTTRRRGQQHLREDHQFGREERDREPGDDR